MKRYGVLVNYAATKGVRSINHPDEWLLEPTDEHQLVLTWHDTLAEAEASRDQYSDLVGESNIDAIHVIEVKS